MLFTKRRIERTVDNGKVMEKVYDSALERLQHTLTRTFFALAIAVGVTPKRLANANDTVKIEEFARKYVEALEKKSAKLKQEKK